MGGDQSRPESLSDASRALTWLVAAMWTLIVVAGMR